MDAREVRAALREVQAKRRALDKEEEALRKLLEVYEPPKKQPKRQRVNGAVRDREILDLLRRNPTKSYTIAQATAATGMSHASARNAIRRLIRAKQVQGNEKDGVSHKPVKVVPGKEVVNG